MSSTKDSQDDDVTSSPLTEKKNEAFLNDQQTIWFKSTLANGYAYLSNFFPHITPAARQAFDIMIQQEVNDNDDFSFIIDDKRYATVEHYYQSQKYIEHYPEQAEAIRTSAKTALEAKEMNTQFKNTYPSLSKFDREYIMLRGLRAKFTQNTLLNKLLKQTTGKILHESSGQTDSKWSNDENLLGRLLMQIRDELQ